MLLTARPLPPNMNLLFMLRKAWLGPTVVLWAAACAAPHRPVAPPSPVPTQVPPAPVTVCCQNTTVPAAPALAPKAAPTVPSAPGPATGPPPIVVKLAATDSRTLARTVATEGLVHAVRDWLNRDGTMHFGAEAGIHYVSLGADDQENSWNDSARVVCGIRAYWLVDHVRSWLHLLMDTTTAEKEVTCTGATCAHFVGGHDPRLLLLHFRHRRSGGWELTSVQESSAVDLVRDRQGLKAALRGYRAKLHPQRCASLPNFSRRYDFPGGW